MARVITVNLYHILALCYIFNCLSTWNFPSPFSINVRKTPSSPAARREIALARFRTLREKLEKQADKYSQGRASRRIKNVATVAPQLGNDRTHYDGKETAILEHGVEVSTEAINKQPEDSREAEDHEAVSSSPSLLQNSKEIDDYVKKLAKVAAAAYDLSITDHPENTLYPEKDDGQQEDHEHNGVLNFQAGPAGPITVEKQAEADKVVSMEKADSDANDLVFGDDETKDRQVFPTGAVLHEMAMDGSEQEDNVLDQNIVAPPKSEEREDPELEEEVIDSYQEMAMEELKKKNPSAFGESVHLPNSQEGSLRLTDIDPAKTRETIARILKNANSYVKPLVSSKVGKHQILYYHFSKAGGHMMCEFASQRGNGEKKTNDLCSNNTWDFPPTDNRPRIIQRSCEEQSDQLRRLKEGFGWTFLAVEFRFHWLQNCSMGPDIIRMALIRDPVSRLASQYNHEIKRGFMPEELQGKSARQIVTNSPTRNIIDNYQVRQILNKTDTEEKQRTPLTEADAIQAIQLLDNVDIVIPLNRLCEALPLLRHSLGWRSATVPSQYNGLGRGSSLSFEPTSWTEVRHMNVYDLALWKRADQRLDEALKQVPETVRQNYADVKCNPTDEIYIPWDKYDENVFRNSGRALW